MFHEEFYVNISCLLQSQKSICDINQTIPSQNDTGTLKIVLFMWFLPLFIACILYGACHHFELVSDPGLFLAAGVCLQ